MTVAWTPMAGRLSEAGRGRCGRGRRHAAGEGGFTGEGWPGLFGREALSTQERLIHLWKMIEPTC